MIKTLFASASTFAYVGCIAVCCMGNDYPAKAECWADGDNSAFYECLNREEDHRQEVEQKQRSY